MTRTYKDIKLPDRIRHVVTIEDNSADDGPARGFAFLGRVLNENPEMLHCGPLWFQKLSVERLDRVWIVTAEASEPVS